MKTPALLGGFVVVVVLRLLFQYLYPLPGTDAVWCLSPAADNLNGHWFQNSFTGERSAFFIGYAAILTPFYMVLDSFWFLFVFYNGVTAGIAVMLWQLLRLKLGQRPAAAVVLLMLCTPLCWHYRPEHLVFLLLLVLHRVAGIPVAAGLLVALVGLVHPFAGLAGAALLYAENRTNKPRLMYAAAAAALVYAGVVSFTLPHTEAIGNPPSLVHMLQSRLHLFSFRPFVEYVKYAFPLVLCCLAGLGGWLGAKPARAGWLLLCVAACLCMGKPYYFHYFSFYLLWLLARHGQWPGYVVWLPLVLVGFAINVAKPLWPCVVGDGFAKSKQIHRVLNAVGYFSNERRSSPIHLPAGFAAPLLKIKKARMLYFNDHTPAFTSPIAAGHRVWLTEAWQGEALQTAYPQMKCDSLLIVPFGQGYGLLQLVVK